MIFVTTGTQAPFDRLIKIMDEIAPLLNVDSIIAQVSKLGFEPKNLKMVGFLDPKEFDIYFSQAALIVSHAGIGTIISALMKEKPIIVFPRLAKFGEHRNNHQLATAEKFESLKYINAAYTQDELKNGIIALLQGGSKLTHKIGDYASDDLIDSIKKFLSS